MRPVAERRLNQRRRREIAAACTWAVLSLIVVGLALVLGFAVRAMS